MRCSLTTSTWKTAKSCRAYFSFTGQIRISRSRSAQRRWLSTAMSLDYSTRSGQSESRRWAIRLGQLLALRRQVLRRRQVPHHHHHHHHHRPNPSLQEPLVFYWLAREFKKARNFSKARALWLNRFFSAGPSWPKVCWKPFGTKIGSYPNPCDPRGRSTICPSTIPSNIPRTSLLRARANTQRNRAARCSFVGSTRPSSSNNLSILPSLVAFVPA